jgi:excisionase family DNA binding protein
VPRANAKAQQIVAASIERNRVRSGPAQPRAYRQAMSELEDGFRHVAHAIEGMIRNAIREELAAALLLRDQQRRTTQSEWMTDAMVAERLGISRPTLYAWRMTAKGPPWLKLGRLVRYKTADVNAWLEERIVGIRQPASTSRRGRQK